ncbi:MAG: hypothetical protein DMG58_09085 [Acidobacteria bacterium]|nr:MAG: hypothetical protein DMG58_09085 [Acidobacteriota bacterium]
MQVLRKVLPYTTAGVVLGALYVTWVFASRWNDNRRIEQAAAAQRSKLDREITELYGTGRLKILSFYATPGLIRRGEKALLCYGVVNARTVRLDPPAERIWPSASRCFTVIPNRETRYTLTAEDAEGRTVTESFVLQVK